MRARINEWMRRRGFITISEHQKALQVKVDLVTWYRNIALAQEKELIAYRAKEQS